MWWSQPWLKAELSLDATILVRMSAILCFYVWIIAQIGISR
jgi:hypothetical protein